MNDELKQKLYKMRARLRRNYQARAIAGRRRLDNILASGELRVITTGAYVVELLKYRERNEIAARKNIQKEYEKLTEEERVLAVLYLGPPTDWRKH